MFFGSENSTALKKLVADFKFQSNSSFLDRTKENFMARSSISPQAIAFVWNAKFEVMNTIKNQVQHALVVKGLLKLVGKGHKDLKMVDKQ